MFIHIPKTGGTSISDALHNLNPNRQRIPIPESSTKFTPVFENLQPFLMSNLEGKERMIPPHVYAKEMMKFLGEETYNRLFKFAFVRNPWDRFFSLYNFIINGKGTHERIKELGTYLKEHENGFKHFLLDVHINMDRVRLDGSYVTHVAQTTPQKTWLADDDGNPIVSFVGKFENLQGDFDKVCSMLDIDAELPWINKFSNSSYVDAYDQEMIDFVAKYHQADIDQWGYDFGK